MSRMERLIEVLIKLQSRPRFTVQELADEFGVSRRTMLRDLHALAGLGVPLLSAPGPAGGYELLGQRRLLPISLTADEAVGMVLAYDALLQYAQSPFAAQSLSAITKLRNALPPDVVQELDRMRQHIAVIEPRPSYQAPLLAELFQAARDHVHLHVSYDSKQGMSERMIYPFGIYAAHGFWYCACYDYRRQQHLSLRADRFVALSRIANRDPLPPIPVADWLAIVERPDGVQLSLRARLTTRGMKSIDLHTLFGPAMIKTDDGGLLETTIPASEIDFYAARFLALGTQIVVETPPELVSAIRRQAEKVVQLYGVEDLAAGG